MNMCNPGPNYEIPGSLHCDAGSQALFSFLFAFLLQASSSALRAVAAEVPQQDEIVWCSSSDEESEEEDYYDDMVPLVGDAVEPSPKAEQEEAAEDEDSSGDDAPLLAEAAEQADQEEAAAAEEAAEDEAMTEAKEEPKEEFVAEEVGTSSAVVGCWLGPQPGSSSASSAVETSPVEATSAGPLVRKATLKIRLPLQGPAAVKSPPPLPAAVSGDIRLRPAAVKSPPPVQAFVSGDIRTRPAAVASGSSAPAHDLWANWQRRQGWWSAGGGGHGHDWADDRWTTQSWWAEQHSEAH
jgi:hypothetical protein